MPADIVKLIFNIFLVSAVFMFVLFTPVYMYMYMYMYILCVKKLA